MENYVANPSLFITLIHQNDTWIAMGSNKIDTFELTASRDDTFADVMSFASRSIYPMMTTYIINGRTRTVATATGNTQLAALGALLDFFKQDEMEELKQNLEYAHRQEELKRFGGSVDEELIRKVVRWRKKQAKKQEYMDAYKDDEYDF